MAAYRNGTEGRDQVRNKGSHSPSGSFADFTTKPVNRVRGHCKKCGCGLLNKAKRYCGPCYDIRLQENIARNRLKYKAEKLAAPPSETK